MDLLLAIILGLRICCLVCLFWYLVEKCCAAFDAREAKAKRRARWQTVWRSSLVCGDEMDYIITREDEPIQWKK